MPHQWSENLHVFIFVLRGDVLPIAGRGEDEHTLDSQRVQEQRARKRLDKETSCKEKNAYTSV